MLTPGDLVDDDTWTPTIGSIIIWLYDDVLPGGTCNNWGDENNASVYVEVGDIGLVLPGQYCDYDKTWIDVLVHGAVCHTLGDERIKSL